MCHCMCPQCHETRISRGAATVHCNGIYCRSLPTDACVDHHTPTRDLDA